MASQPRLPQTSVVKGRRLRGALRRARESAKLTQKQVAEALYWSPSKVIRIEQGTVPVAPVDVAALLRLYGVTDQGEIDSMTDLAVGARDRDNAVKYRASYSDETLSLFGNEVSADVIFKYEPSVVPGFFQIEEYASSLMRALGLSESDTRDRVADRMERAGILASGTHPRLRFILGEAVLSRPIGGNAVMIAQIQHLKHLATLDGIELQVLLFAEGAHEGMGSAFTVLQFDDENIPDLLYLQDGRQRSTSVENPEEVKEYLERFVQLRSMATTPEEVDTVLNRFAVEKFGADPAEMAATDRVVHTA